MASGIEVDRRVLEAFRLLSNPINIELLILLSSGELNPRELARLTGRDETDVSRRLRRLERAGIVVGEWKRVAGRNIRVYRLRSGRLCLRLGRSGVSLGPEPGVEPRALAERLPALLSPPRPPPGFAGRKRELRELARSSGGLVVVVGLPGVGKTSLLAAYASEAGRPTAWYTFTGLEDLRSFYWKLALYFARLGDDRLLSLVQPEAGGLDEMASGLAEVVDRYRAILVLDDFHRVADSMVTLLVARTAPLLEKGLIVVASRRRPGSLLANVPGARLLVLQGLSPSETREMLELLGLELSPQMLSKLYAVTQGHPLLVRLFAELASRRGAAAAVRAVEEQGFRELWRSLLESLSPCEAEVLTVLAELSVPAPGELLGSLVQCRQLGVALYRLADTGLVDETGGGYTVRDIVARLYPRRSRPSLLIRAGDWFLSRSTPEDMIRAVSLYTRAGSEKHLVKAIRHRITHIGLEMNLAAQAYARELLKALEAARSPYTKAHLLLELASTDMAAGRLREAVEKAWEAYRILQGYHDMYAMLVAVARLLWFYPTFLGSEEAEKLLREGERLAGKVDPGTLLGAVALNLYYANLARYHAMRGEIEEVIKDVEAEIEMAKAAGTRRYDIALSKIHLAIALGLACRYKEAANVAEEVLASLYPDAPRPLVAKVLWVLSSLYLGLGRWGDAYRAAREALSGLEESMKVEGIVEVLGVQVGALLGMGSTNTAYRVARRLVAVVRERIGSWKGFELPGIAAATAYAAAGEDSEELIEEVLAALRERGDRLAWCEAKTYIDLARRHLEKRVVERIAQHTTLRINSAAS